ncbi:GAF domain-containing protein [Hymenobacter bucti]|uniref:GAF domain-containing protein n=1 Tax=Hymenobacter bucti TaxID=1844114 RepID=A0ABW4QXS2_9BACT
MTPVSSQLPDAEAARLRSLRAHDVLPTLSEPVFDEYVALTARIFSLPISLISVVTKDTVYYPANQGMPGNDQQQRVEALCSTAIAQAHTAIYCDLDREPSASIPPEAWQAAQDNELRFYAGALVFLPDQRPLGTLCIIDRRPRTFTAEEQHILELLAALVSQTIVVRHRCRAQPETDGVPWERLSNELQEEVQALNALVRYLAARFGTMVPVPATFLTQVESRIRDLQELLDDYCS